jgi:retron-type reverse transcriptase
MGLFDWIKGLFGSGMPKWPCGHDRVPGTTRCWSCEPTGASPLSSFDPPQPEAPRKESKLSLKAEQLLPISDAELRKKAKSINLWGNPWFGLRDRIPPATDARTMLIDRAMITRGYVTPEEIVEMHEVGDLMLKLKPDMIEAERRAKEDLEKDRERRKAEKKKAAAEKRARHAEAVRRRRLTDILFLGRGVSRGLADRRSNIEKLEKAGLPVMSTPSDVAALMGLTIPQLRWLAYHSDAAQTTHYARFQIPKRSGGMREIASPHRHLRRAQGWILERILSKAALEAPAHGFIPGKSILTNAAMHVKKAVVVNVDLKDFFPTISMPRVMGALRTLGYSPAVSTILALICTESPRQTVAFEGATYHVATGPRALPQGACTSPALSNLVSRRLDRRLAGMARKHGWTYTRYADDLTFSSDSKEGVAMLLARIRHIVTEEGFEINPPKIRVLKRNAAQTVTGIVVNEKPNAPRSLRRLLRAVLHRAKKTGLAPAEHPKLRGRIEFVRMVNPPAGSKLLEQFKLIRPFKLP